MNQKTSFNRKIFVNEKTGKTHRQPHSISSDLYPALNQFIESLHRAHTQVLKSLRLKDIPPSPPKIAFWNWKTIRDILVGSKLKDFIYDDEGVDICDCSNYNICNILENKNCLKVLLQSKNITLIFHLIVIALVWCISWNI